MKVAPIFIFLLPYLTLAAYDESSRRKVKLEDIENEHVQNERHSKVIHSLPPPFSKQPAKGQAKKIYSIPTTSEDSVPEYQKPNPSSSNRYALTTQHHVQPLVDQVTASEADYQQSPAYQRETIIYFPNHAHGQSVLQGNSLQKEQQQQAPQQPTSLFYYSHDVQQTQHQQRQLSPNDYQLQFVPIGQNGRHDEENIGAAQHIDSSKAIITYSHDVGNTQLAIQPVQYVSNAENQKPNEGQSIYNNLPANVLFQSPKDIEYAKPTNTYGPPSSLHQPTTTQKVVEYSQDVSIPKTPTHHYTSQNDAQAVVRPSSTYGGLESQESLFYQQKDIEFANTPAIVYGPPHGEGEEPQIQYGAPDASFRQPVFQSNQDAYAPRRPDYSNRSNSKPLSVSFPFPPSFISITTEHPLFEKASPTSEPSYVEVPQWQANIMPLHLTPPQESQYRSFATAEGVRNPILTASPDVNINQHIDVQTAPLIDFFHSRQAKSLLESYIPSWLVAQMQEQHVRHLHQKNQQHQHQQHQNFDLSSQTAENNYNTIAYSTDFDNIYGPKLKRSISTSKLFHQKRKPGRK